MEKIIEMKLDDNIIKLSFVIIDNSQNIKELMVLNTKDFKKVEITYTEEEKDKTVQTRKIR